MKQFSGLVAFAATAAVALSSPHATAQESTPPQPGGVPGGAVTVHTVTSDELAATSIADIANARAMPLPRVDIQPMESGGEPLRQGAPGFKAGNAGTGKTAPVVVPEEDTTGDDGDLIPEEFGTSNHPFTTARVNSRKNNVQKTFPYSASGKLYFKDGGLDFVCSGSLIAPGIVVTAAHCVSAFGENRYFTNIQFVPARFARTAPFGVWNGAAIAVMPSYLDGTDNCAVPGIICENDVAVVSLDPQGGTYPGPTTGWLGYGWNGYGWNGYGFTPDNTTLINQLGYPVSHDKGRVMQRTDSQGFVSDLASNTVWGSRQTGGSSGGPEVINLGKRGKLKTPVGSDDAPNIIIGVTSWLYLDPTIQQLGASPFTSNNIVSLVNAICAGGNPACE